jgi:WD40 repeat protein
MPTDPAQIHAGPQWKHTRPLTACRFDPTNKFAFTGAEDNFVTRWDLATGTPTPLAGHDSWVRAIACSADGQTLFSGGYDGRVIWWPASAEKPEPARKIDAHQGWVRAIALSPNGQQLASCGNDNVVKVWNVADGALVAELPGHASHVYNVAWHPDGNSLASCDLKGVVKQWNVTEKKMVREFTAAALHKYDDTFRADIGGARSLAFSRDGKQLAVGGITNVSNAFAGIGNPAVVLLNWEDGKPIVQYGGKEKIQGVMWGVRQSPDGYWIGLTGGGGGGWLYFWRDAAADEFFKFKLTDNGRDLDLSPDGTKMAVAHSDNHLRLYNLFAKMP